LLACEVKKKQIQVETSFAGKQKERKLVAKPILEQLEKYEGKQPQTFCETLEGVFDWTKEILLTMSETERQEHERRERQERERELERRRNE
jgi:hypothetical protein